jgi:DNA polymerase-3 subunit epsilon
MKTIIVFDTETTGLPDRAGFDKNYPAWDIRRYNNSRVIQLGYAIYTLSGFLLSENMHYIKPDKWTITADSEKIHGISQDKCLKEGKPIRDVLRLFEKDLADCVLLVGHNVAFDQHVLSSEAWRCCFESLAIKLDFMTYICTMRSSKELCNIKQKNAAGKENIKFPKLCELYKFLFGYEPVIQHDALEDVKATARCYFHLKEKGYVI